MGKKNLIKLLYSIMSIPIILVSLLYYSCSKEHRKLYQSVAKKVVESPNLKFENMLITQLIIAEDRRFKWHYGFDPIAILRAAISTLFYKKLQGASTVEQQFVRTITKRYEITISRKIQEILLSCLISITNQKQDIAFSYLCVAYFGKSINGYAQAIQFVESCTQKTQESKSKGAYVISMLKRPKPCNFRISWEKRLHARARFILEKYDLAYGEQKQMGRD